MPVFMGMGTEDDIVLPAWSSATLQFLRSMGMQHIQNKAYPIGHAVCLEELSDLSDWLNQHLGGIA